MTLTAAPERSAHLLCLRCTMPSDRLYSQIARGLQKEPAYLLAFGVILLLTGASITFVVRGDDSTVRLTALAVLAVSVLLFTFSIVYLIRNATQPERDTAWEEFEFDTVEASDVQSRVSSFIGCVRKATETTNQSFRKAMISRIDDFTMEASNWKKGEISDLYGHFDLASDIFENAKKSVFSTSVPEFLPFWQDPAKGERLLNAHKVSSATVTRVFIFNSREEIDDHARTILKKHDEIGKIKALVYIDNETPFEWPAHIMKDFTIVDDGDAIAVASAFRSDEMVGVWYFDTSEIYNAFDSVRKRLESESVPVSSVIA